MYYDNNEIPAETIVFGCVVRSEHRIDIKCTTNLNVFRTERFIQKTFSFWDSLKKFRIVL